MKEKTRIWEIDFLRGIAVLLMIYFHVIFDLKEFYSFNVSFDQGFQMYLAKGTAGLFILLSGISVEFSKSNFKRGMKVFGVGLVLTLIGVIFTPDLIIKFGILHFLGVSMMMSVALKKLKIYLLLPLSLSLFIIDYFLRGYYASNDYLMFLGLRSKEFVSADYFPIVPWLGVFILGIIIGRTIYKEKKSLFKFEFKLNFMNFIGRNTLLIYLIHQPIILLILYCLFKIVKV